MRSSYYFVNNCIKLFRVALIYSARFGERILWKFSIMLSKYPVCRFVEYNVNAKRWHYIHTMRINTLINRRRHCNRASTEQYTTRSIPASVIPDPHTYVTERKRFNDLSYNRDFSNIGSLLFRRSTINIIIFLGHISY